MRARRIKLTAPIAADVEILEDRTLLAAFTVDNMGDVDDGNFAMGEQTLREAINQANGNGAADTIDFAPALSGMTILLGGTELSITEDVTITGLGADVLTIDADGNSRVFQISAGSTVEISGLKITGGDTPDPGGMETGSGAGILALGSLTLIDSDVSGNVANVDGGGIASPTAGGSLSVIRSTISENTADGSGGGISIVGNVSVINSTISGNTVNDEGGGIGTGAGFANLQITNSTITNNRADNNNDPAEPNSNSGGGIIVAGGSTVRLDNTIVAGNFRGMGAMEIFDDITGTVVAGSTNNLIGDPLTAGGLSNTSGNIVGSGGAVIDITTVIDTVLQLNGGTTPTHDIVAGSPVIDAGNDAAAVNAMGMPLVTDQRSGSFERFADGDGDTVMTVDIGAVELPVLVHVVDNATDESDDDFSLGDFSLREAVEQSNLLPGISVIRFSPALAGVPIILTDGVIDVTDTVTIEGLGQPDTNISGGDNSGIFAIANGIIFGITEVTLSGGAGSKGGAIFNDGSDVTVTRTTFLANNAVLGSGGAIANDDGNLSVDGVTFESNGALAFGGAIYNTGNNGATTIANSTFSANFAELLGGAIYSDNGVTAIINSTISGNTANRSGGGIANESALLTVTNSTITGNRADADGDGFGVGSGGGIHSPNDFGGTTTIVNNSIIIDNFYGTGSTNPNDIAVSIDPTSAYNIVGTPAFAGMLTDGVNGNIIGDGVGGVLDPLTVIDPALADNGGGTLTHLLIDGSPAIDAGNTALAVDELTQPLRTDQRDGTFERVRGPRVDIGAVEVIPLADIFSRADTGSTWILKSDGTQFIPEKGTTPGVFTGVIPLSVDWDDFVFGDFNADGLQDIAGRSPSDGQWRVLLANGQGFDAPALWGSWSTAVTFTDVLVGDFNGDNLDDIAARASTGTWVVAFSNGTQFVTQAWGAWSKAVTWSHVQIGDFNGDQQADIIGLSSTGRLVAGLSTGTNFAMSIFSTLANSVTYENVLVGDFDGDYLDDITVRASTGTWLIGLSDTASFNWSVAGAWSSLVTWSDVTVADYNGDGKDDIAGRSSTGRWVVGISDGASYDFTIWNTWNNVVTWTVVVGDFNGDGKDDIAGRSSSGGWYVNLSTGSQFNFSLWRPTLGSIMWDNESAGNFA